MFKKWDKVSIILVSLTVGFVGAAAGLWIGSSIGNKNYTTVKSTRTEAKRYYDVPLSHDLQDYLTNLCEINDVDPALILAVMRKESNFQSDLISDTNDYGLLQINKVNHDWLKSALNITDFLNPEDNILAGVYMLSGYLHKYPTEQALMCYNSGEATAKYQWDKGIKSTDYTEDIMLNYEYLTQGDTDLWNK